MSTLRRTNPFQFFYIKFKKTLVSIDILMAAAYQVCQSHPPHDPNAEFDEFIQFKGNLYTWSGAGQYGRAYSSVEPLEIQGAANQRQKVLIKLMPYLSDPNNAERQAQFDKEVELQMRAAQHQCGPVLYETGTGILLHSPDSPFQFQPNSPYCHYTHANYMLMEYYDRNEGWTSLPAYRIIGNTSLCDFIVNRLYTLARVVVSRDAAGHFFFHPQKGYRMIDYGQAELAENVPMRDFLEQIKESLTLDCVKSPSSYGKVKTQKNKKNPYSKKKPIKGGKRTQRKRKHRKDHGRSV